MRTILLTYGKPYAYTGSDIPITEKGETIGVDLYCESAPGKWIPATALPPGALEEAKRNGSLQAEAGITYDGKKYSQLNVLNTYERFLAASRGIRFKTEERVVVSSLKHRLEGLITQLQRLRVAELKAKLAHVEELEASVKNAKKTHIPRTEPERSSPFPWVNDLKRTFTGKPITTSQLESAAIAQTLLEKGFGTNEGSALDPETMAGLRGMLDQKTMRKRATTFT